MDVLADTGILVRLLEPTDPDRPRIERAVDAIRARGDRTVVAPQNAAEFWTVCTRPASSRGGYGLTLKETERRLTLLEAGFPVLVEPQGTYAIWRSLVVAHAVLGRQVHDARLVALMKAHGITHILTLNGGDFARYPGITVIDPASFAATRATAPPPSPPPP